MDDRKSITFLNHVRRREGLAAATSNDKSGLHRSHIMEFPQ
jgi:hypothetical protein